MRAKWEPVTEHPKQLAVVAPQWSGLKVGLTVLVTGKSSQFDGFLSEA